MAVEYNPIPEPHGVNPAAWIKNFKTGGDNWRLARLASRAQYYTSTIPSGRTFAQLVASIGDATATIFVNSEVSIAANLTVPENISIHVIKGGSFAISTGVTLTINGAFEAGAYQTKTGDGTLALNRGSRVLAEWFGAAGDNSTDDKDAFDEAAAVAYAGKLAIHLGNKIYYLSSWNLNNLANGLLICGTGEQSRIRFGNAGAYGFRIDGGCRKIVIRDLWLSFPDAASQDCFQLGVGGSGASQAYECSFHNLTITGNSASTLQSGLVIEQAYIHQFYNCKILNFGINVIFKEQANSCTFYGCSIRSNQSNNIRLIDAQGGEQNAFFGGDIENCESWVRNTGTEGMEFVGVYFEASQDVAIRLEAGYTKFDKCFLSEGRAYIYEGGRSSFRDNRIRKTGTSFFLYFIHYAKLTFDAAGYTNFVSGDIGRSITSAGGSAKIVSYDNGTRIVLVIPTADFTNGDACTTSGGTGGGTLAAVGGYAQNTPMTPPMFTADSNRMEYTTPGSTTTGLFTRAFATGVQSWKWDASGPSTATLSNYLNINQERIFDVNTSTLKTLILNYADGLYLNGPVDANVGQSRMMTLALTQTTGTAPLAITSTTKVSNLNVDRLDDLDSTDFARRYSVTTEITGGTGWYRAAANGTVGVGGTNHNRAGALFSVYDRTGGQHAICRFYAAIQFGNQPTIQVLHSSAFTSRRLTKIRMVYNPTPGTAEGAAIDIEITGGSSEDVKVVIDENEGTTGWAISDLSAASVPGGSYTTMEFNLSTNNPVMGMSADGLANVWELRRDGRTASGQTPTATVPAIRHTTLYKLAGVNLNSASTDTGTFTGLPGKYRVIRLTAFDASISLTTATFDLRTAAAGGGTALVSAFAPTALTAAAKYVDATLASAATTDYQTAATLYVRNVTAQGAAATASFLLEIQVLD